MQVLVSYKVLHLPSRKHLISLRSLQLYGNNGFYLAIQIKTAVVPDTPSERMRVHNYILWFTVANVIYEDRVAHK